MFTTVLFALCSVLFITLMVVPNSKWKYAWVPVALLIMANVFLIVGAAATIYGMVLRR